jgi:hypothetical protein
VTAISKITRAKRGGVVAQVVECSSVYVKFIDQTPIPKKEIKKGKREREKKRGKREGRKEGEEEREREGRRRMKKERKRPPI